ncbi:hypothetical protein [Jeotgalibacillus sp. R-1-5s-1]|uniref:hypothetical protein n=1 Tax=Jeotgalibacillus sp. R-1-5s-1 TaxID=2555897 RepID=UPI0010699729|nr:hypothetical protein [Jeotgalibacillus sp. R-1-5s-1]TFE00119.1 hypothetical protein E2491_06680 [Jeotgalibacillus sp. R-1-5s-1]
MKDPHYEQIRQVDVRVSEMKGASYRTIIDFDELKISRMSEHAYRSVRFPAAIIAPQTKDIIIEKLKHLHLFEWEDAYLGASHHSTDNTHWHITIQLDNCTIEKKGYNQFPAEWDNFMRILL